MTPVGNGRLVSIASHQIAGLVDHYYRFLTTHVRAPWDATDIVLAARRPSVYVRSEQTGDAPEPWWYVQIAFTGAAGESEVTATVACHWAERWYRECSADLTDHYFTPFGFQPESVVPESEAATFRPTQCCGYAAYSADAWGQLGDDGRPAPRFDVDGCHRATEPGAEVRLRNLETRYTGVMADGRCRCQLCMPEFDPRTVDI